MVTAWVHEPDDLERGFAHLDQARLNAQRGNEGVVVARALARHLETGEWTGYGRTPMVQMWAGHEHAFAEYEQLAVAEWTRRGFEDGCLPEYERLADATLDTGPPDWWRAHPIHSQQRFWLLLRRPQHYQPLGWPETEAAWDWMWTHRRGEEPALDWPRPSRLITERMSA